MSDDAPVPGRDLDAGRRLFDAAEYWHAHEAWEEQWKHDRSPERDFIKGLIQVAAAMLHWRKGAHPTAAKLMAQARGHLVAHAHPRWECDQTALLAQVDELASEIADGAAWRREPLAGFG